MDEVTVTINPRFIPFRCPNCKGHKTVSYGKYPCGVCKEKGVLVVDQETGLPVKDDEEDGHTKQNTAT